MKCPVDDTELVISDRQGIEIDYCPKCRGVWLDRGELDKIIERTAPAEVPPPRSGYRYDERDYGRDDERRYGRDDERHHHRGYRKRKSLLSELFDFD